LRFGDASLEGMLKGILVRDVLEELKLNSAGKFPYLESRITEEVDSGRYFHHHRMTRQQTDRKGQGLQPLKASALLPDIRWLRKHIPGQQHSFYLKTGFYVREGILYAGTNQRPMENLTRYVQQGKTK